MRFVIERCRLDEVLRELGLSRRHVTERTGILRQQLYRYANNHDTMTLEVAVTIAESIGVDPRSLYIWRRLPNTTKA
jgi:transcriptional regulator with XRE-family HTH domain